MSTDNRVKILRTSLKLSQKTFGEELGITDASVCRIESGVQGLTEQMAKLICQIFHVNYLWLTEGKGEMFEAPGSALDDLAMQYDLNEIDLYLIKAYLDMPKDERAEFSEAILNKLLTILKKELHTDQKN